MQAILPFLVLLLVGAALCSTVAAEGPPEPTLAPLGRTVDLDVGESATLTLCDGKKATVKLVKVEAQRDTICRAVRAAHVTAEVNGKRVELVSANYRLPVTAAGVRIDCPITFDYCDNSTRNMWGIKKAARFRLWPAGSPLLAPGTFRYPARQRWFAAMTQMANEPVYVNGCELPGDRKIYYHNGLDIGGTDAGVPVIAATDSLVVSRGTEVLPGYEKTPARPRYDVVYAVDVRGWYYRYSHLDSIDAGVKLGGRLRQGDPVGILGKEGASGGWSHLHFDITARQPSGEWGTEEGYAYLWEAYVAEHRPKLIAVARPHYLLRVGESVTLDGSRSWSAAGPILTYEWSLSDGSIAAGAKVERRYATPGFYSETLKVTDGTGRSEYDFAVVEVQDPEQPKRLPPALHATYTPTFGIRPGDPVTFTVRSFRTTQPGEVWDFGDGSDPVRVKSDGNASAHNKEGYARCVHRYARPGVYLARVEHVNEHGLKATARVVVRVEQ